MSVRTPRGRRGTAGTLAALVGLVVCAAGAVEALYLAVNDKTWLYESSSLSDFLARTTLGSSAVLVTAVVLAVLGLLALLAGLIPPKRRLVELGGDEKMVSTGLTRRSLRRTLRSAAEAVDGVGSAPVKVGRGKVTVTAATSLRRTDGLADRGAGRGAGPPGRPDPPAYPPGEGPPGPEGELRCIDVPHAATAWV